MKRVYGTFLILIALAANLAGQVPAPSGTVVKTIGYVKTDTALEVNIRIEGEFVHQPLVLASPTRLVIDVAPAQKIEAHPFYAVGAFNVTAIRTGQFQPQISRIIFDISGDMPAYDIRKTDTGLTVRFSFVEKPAEKPAAPPVEAKPAQVAPPPVRREEPTPRPSEAEVTGAPEGFYNTAVGVTFGTYKNPDSRFGEVYGTGTYFQYGLNLSRTLLNFRGFQVDLSFEVRTFSRDGNATLTGEASTFSMVPISLAGRLQYQTKYVIPFVGGGADWYHYKETSSLANTSGSASGYHFQAGAFIVLPNLDFLRVKLYYKWTSVTATENGIDVKLGGPEYGVGISFGFNLLSAAVITI
jgi:hypothetical protein